MHGTRTGTSGEPTNPDWNIRGAEDLDWNVRGRSRPGLELPGLQNEEDTARERSGEENMNESKEQVRKDTKNKSREEGGEGEGGEVHKRMECGLEHPGKQRARTGTSWNEAALDPSVRGSIRRKTRRRDKKRPGEHEQEPGTMEREDTKNKSREAGGEGEAGEADNTWNSDWNILGSNSPGLEHPGGGSP